MQVDVRCSILEKSPAMSMSMLVAIPGRRGLWEGRDTVSKGVEAKGGRGSDADQTCVGEGCSIRVRDQTWVRDLCGPGGGL